MILDMGIHDFDLARFFMGEVQDRARRSAGTLAYPELQAVGDLDNAIVSLVFADGRLGVVDLSRNGIYGYDISTELLGTEGTLRVGYLRETPLFVMKKNQRRPRHRARTSWSASRARTRPSSRTSPATCCEGRPRAGDHRRRPGRAADRRGRAAVVRDRPAGGGGFGHRLRPSPPDCRGQVSRVNLDWSHHPWEPTRCMSDVLAESQRFWDAHARRDPFWAVLSEAGKEGRRWDARRFFQTGVNEIAQVLYQLDSHGIDVARGSALDFGCGVGRLTQALAPWFDRVVGVDLSPEMIGTATALNRFPDRASYVWNEAPHLEVLGDGGFDFVYTSLVLQHVSPDVMPAYLKELVRVLEPAGILVFQLPSHQRTAQDPSSPAAPMPDDAYRAALSVAGLPGVPLRPGAQVTLDVDVTNASRVPWTRREFGTITVGNHWLDHTGSRMLQCDDGRTPLPDLGPGGTCRVPLTVTTPASEGSYLCEVDLAHEGVRWFRDRDSPVARMPVAVRVGGSEPPGTAAIGGHQPAPHAGGAAPVEWPGAAPGDPSVADPGHFPMHLVHTDLVGRLIADCGGELLQRTEDHACGPGWISYRYFVRKAARPR